MHINHVDVFDTQQIVIWKVRLIHDAIRQCDILAHRTANRESDTALHLSSNHIRVARNTAPKAQVTRYSLNAFICLAGNFDHFGHIGVEALGDCNALASTFRGLSPTGLPDREFHNPGKTSLISIIAVQHSQLTFQRVSPCGSCGRIHRTLHCVRCV